MPNQPKRRTSSRTRAKKASATKGLVTPVQQNKSSKTLRDEFDSECVHSDATAHTNNQGSPSKEELAELEAFEAEMTARNGQQANEESATSTKPHYNAHSAQAKLNASLYPNSYQSRLRLLQTQALAKRDKFSTRLLSLRVKKIKEKYYRIFKENTTKI